MINIKYIVGGLLLIANLFLSTYYTNVEDVATVNHVLDLEPYSLKSYWYQFYLHFTPIVYLVVFVLLKVDWEWLKWVYLLVEGFKILDFYLGYNDVLIDADVVGAVMSLAIIAYVTKKIIN